MISFVMSICNFPMEPYDINLLYYSQLLCIGNLEFDLAGVAACFYSLIFFPWSIIFLSGAAEYTTNIFYATGLFIACPAGYHFLHFYIIVCPDLCSVFLHLSDICNSCWCQGTIPVDSPIPFTTAHLSDVSVHGRKARKTRCVVCGTL